MVDAEQHGDMISVAALASRLPLQAHVSVGGRR
jgi:hypothetical protein